MLISWYGQSCFKIQTKAGSDGLSLVTDPFSSGIGLKEPNTGADIVTVSHNHFDHNNVKAIKGDPYIIDTPGEFEVKGVLAEGIQTYHDEEKGSKRGNNIIYRIEMEDISLAHLGDLGHTLSSKELESLNGIDILFVPVGGKFTINAKTAVEVISQIEPRMVIPMHYKVEGLEIDLAGVDEFIKELALNPTYEDKLKIEKKDLPSEDMELVVFNL